MELTRNANVNDLFRMSDQPIVECFKIPLKRKSFEELSRSSKELANEDEICKIKRFKNNNLEIKSINTPIKTASPILIKSHQFKKRILKSYSNKKILKSLANCKKKKSISKPFLNLNNLSIFDTKSVYKFKFEQIIKRVFEKINACSLDNDYKNKNLSNDKNILDLNQLFQFSDSDLDKVLDDNLMNSLKASFLGKGAFGRVFKTRLEQKYYAIKIGLSNSFYGCTGDQNALILNEHPNVVKTYHILKLKLTNDQQQQLLKEQKQHQKSTHQQRKLQNEDDDFPMTMNANISYHTIKHIIDLNILKLIDLFPKFKLYSTLNVIIMEYAGDISLQQLIDDSTNQKITKARRINFAKQIADALVYLKNKSIAHLDLKPANIMIRRTDDFLKLIDFGCSKKNYQQLEEPISFNLNESYDLNCKSKMDQLSPFKVNSITDKENSLTSKLKFSQLSTSNKLLNFENTIMSSLIKNSKKLNGQNHCNIGTISHTAPELFRNDTVKNIFQADVYSFSIILWQLVTRQIPYSGDNIHSIIYRVASGKLRPKFDPIFYLEEKNYYDLTIKMWNHDPDHRPSIEFIFKTLNKS